MNARFSTARYNTARFNTARFSPGSNAGPSISVALEYDKSAPSIRLFLTAARRGGVADALAVTQFDVEGADNLDSVTDEVSAELADTTAPGALTGATGQKVTAMSGAVADGLYLVSYEVTAADPDVTLFPFPGGPLKFVEGQFPSTVGLHHVLATAEDTGTGDAIRKGGTGNITISAMSIKRAEWTVDTTLMTAGDEIAFTIARGEADRGATVTVPTASEIYVAPGGSDTLGTGAQASPYQTPQFASSKTAAGDTVYLRPGVYAPFEVEGAGTDGNPVEYTAKAGEERQARIIGSLASHDLNKTPGQGVDASLASEDGIKIVGKSYVNIRNLHIEQVSRHFISVTGVSGETHGNIVISGNSGAYCGDAGAFVAGDRFNNLTGTPAIRIDGVIIENNDFQKSNEPSQFNDEDDLERRGGANELVTVGGGAANVIVRNNDLHDSLQYGIDFKGGAEDCAAYGNRIWNMEKFGIYVDCGDYFARDIAVYNNLIWNCRVGIATAREVDGATDIHVLQRVDIYNNTVWNCGRLGIYAQRHPKDNIAIAAGRDGVIEDVSIRFNTIYNANSISFNDDGDPQEWATVRLDDFSGIGTGIDFIGNVLYGDKDLVVVDNWTGETGFTVDDNLNLASGTPTDPLFVAPDTTVVLPTTHRGPMTLPDFTLQEASPAIGIVTTASYIAAPFNVGAGGNTRVLDADAGAYAPVLNFEVVQELDGSFTVAVESSGDIVFSNPGSDTYPASADITVLSADVDTTASVTLANPRITGDLSTGSTLQLIPGVVAINEALGALTSRQMQLIRDPSGTATVLGTFNGESIDEYTIASADAGEDLVLRQTIVQSGQSNVIINSPAVSVLAEYVETAHSFTSSTLLQYDNDLLTGNANEMLCVYKVKVPGLVNFELMAQATSNRRGNRLLSIPRAGFQIRQITPSAYLDRDSAFLTDVTDEAIWIAQYSTKVFTGSDYVVRTQMWTKAVGMASGQWVGGRDDRPLAQNSLFDTATGKFSFFTLPGGTAVDLSGNSTYATFVWVDNDPLTKGSVPDFNSASVRDVFTGGAGITVADPAVIVENLGRPRYMHVITPSQPDYSVNQGTGPQPSQTSGF